MNESDEAGRDEKYGHFLGEVLEPWCGIEGSEVGGTMQMVREAALRAVNYLGPPGLRIMLALDEAVRDMVSSEWFTEMLGEEREPHDYYSQGVGAAMDAFEPARHRAIASCKQFGGRYGGAEAEALIRAYDPIRVDLP
jgi:hypothetical protein